LGQDRSRAEKHPRWQARKCSRRRRRS
jgi:hypothetical protein